MSQRGCEIVGEKNLKGGRDRHILTGLMRTEVEVSSKVEGE